MKIQCACGTKVAFDITPDMAVNPVQFVCPVCGLDSSAMVNQMIREHLGVGAHSPTAPAPTPVAPAPSPAPVPAPTPVAAPRPAMRIASHAPAPVPVPAASEPDVPRGREFCLKHPGHEVNHKCAVCGKPMCPECMALFGYVCSPLCRNKAEARGQDIPVYAQQKSVVEARRWRKIGFIGGGIGAVAALLLGAWFWYAWFGCRPKVIYAMSFPEKARSGEVQLAGANNLVYLHGGELGRIDMKQPQPVWTAKLVDRSSFRQQAEQTAAAAAKARERYIQDTGETDFRVPSVESLMDDLEEGAILSLRLEVAGQNIWVGSGDKLTSYDWQTGKPGKVVPLEGGTYGLHRKGDELVHAEMDDDGMSEIVRHINLQTGEVTKETAEKKPIPEKLIALLTNSVAAKPGKSTAANKSAKPNTNAVNALTAKVVAANQARRLSAPLDPQKLADQAQNMSYAGKLALPVLIANARNQQRIAAEIAGEADKPAPPPTELQKAIEEWDNMQVIAAADGPVQFTRTLLERKLVSRDAMKAPPKKSALDGNVSAANSMEVANEMLNEMQRERGSTVTEDQSRYQVTVKRSGSNIPVWTGEVTGPPTFHPLKTVDIITAGTSVIALDHENKKIWQGSLNFPVLGGHDVLDDENESEFHGSGLGPCVERGDTIFIFDQGSLSAFDRATGNSRWRLPSVGITGLWFDEKGMIYVNTTTAGPESIRYSKQINLNNQILTQILKVDPKTGKTLWHREGAKHISYMWKDYIITTDSFVGDDPEGEGTISGVAFPPFLRIRRISASNGQIVWEHVQKRCPIAMHFHENTIQLMFRKEVQFLKFMVL